MKIYNYIIILLFVSSILYPQSSNLIKKNETDKIAQQDELIFKEIETGIREAEVTKISKYFGQQTYFSFSNGINGYYSNNQAFYVVDDFFKLYRVISFKFDHIKSDKNNSYATGKYNYDNRGQRSSAQVYISLKKIGNNWNITQFTIN
ncbi:MAG TPA: DUF4783 domain-containing protein [Ignavibacteriaceae bacterium]